MSLVRAADVAPVPWKNGGGTTRDLAAGAGWRVSLAGIARDGAFSDYPGVERWFAVVAGDGVELAFADRRVRVRAGDAPIVFPGRPAPHCRLLGGPVQALNLLLEGGRRGGLSVQPPAPGLRLHFDPAAQVLDDDPAQPAPGLWIAIAP